MDKQSTLIDLLKKKVRDKINNGDSIVNDQGEIIQVEISARDLATLGSLILKIDERDLKEANRNGTADVEAFPAMPAMGSYKIDVNPL